MPLLMHRALIAAVVLASAVLCTASIARAEMRLALIIANSSYAGPAALTTVETDADLVAEALTRLGFEVKRYANLDQAAMTAAITTFGDKVKAAGRQGVGFAYYAGHAIQVDGVNWLLPISARPRTPAELKTQAVRADALTKSLTDLSGPAHVVVIDAARESPLSTQLKLARGLAFMDAPAGVLLAAPAAPGELADANDNANRYAIALSDALKGPAQPIEGMFKTVRQVVFAATDGRQVTWERSSLLADYVLGPWTSRPATVVPVTKEPAASPSQPPVVAPALKKSESRPVVVIAARTGNDETKPHACDERAACSCDTRAVAPGRELDAIEPVSAIAACRGAVATNPDIDRFRFQLARALQRAGVFDEAHKLYAELADRGYVAAQSALGVAYRDGIGASRDDAEAERWLRRGAEANDPAAMDALAQLLREARGPAGSSPAEATTWYRRAAERGVVSAMYNLALALRDGRGVAANPAEAAVWLRRAVDKGHAGAMTSLAVMQENGTGVARDAAAALALYRQAAELGNGAAMNNLGTMYRDGRGVPRNDAEAVDWLRRAAEKGDARAITSLGRLYAEGRGVERDDGEAVALYRRAADLGNALAQHNLGWMLQCGCGVERDVEEGARLVHAALEKGELTSQRQLVANWKAWAPEFRSALQRRLQAAGVYSGPTNGTFGRDTLRAIAAVASRGRG